jgi:hypothetical protein
MNHPLERTLRATTLALALGLAPAFARAADGAWQDCNANGVEDAVDIALGTSVDVDRNGIPDECESALAPAPPAPARSAATIPATMASPFAGSTVFPRAGRACVRGSELLAEHARPSSARWRRVGDV